MANATQFKPTAVTNTLAASHQDIARRLGIPATYMERSTINEHLDILPAQRPDDPSVYSKMRYLVLGNKGCKPTMISGVSVEMPMAHSPKDVAPWGIIPIVVRELDDDLPETIRDLFCMRKIQEFQGQRYITYSAMRLEYSGIKVQDYLTTVTDGIKSTREDSYTDADLRPKQPELPDYNYDAVDQVLTSDGTYTHANAVTLITLNEFVLNELINMARVCYNSPLAAVVSEWCLCSGIDFTAKGESFVGAPEIYYKEAICMQVNMFVCQYANAADHSDKMELNVSVGQTTPYPLYTSIANG